MLAFWNSFAKTFFVTGIATLPAPQSCANLYAKAKHSIPLYRTAQVNEGNFEADITVGSQTICAV